MKINPFDDPFEVHETSDGMLVEALGLSQSDRERISVHLEALRTLGMSGFLLPLYVVDEDGSLKMPYDGPWDLPGAVTTDDLRKVADALFAAHNRGLVHGAINSCSILRFEGLPVLAGFGSAPLLDSRGPSPRTFVAPEHAAGGCSSKGDQFAFAHLAAHLVPEIADTEWYRTCTATNPEARYARMREVKNALPALETAPTPQVLVPEGGLVDVGAEAPEPVNGGGVRGNLPSDVTPPVDVTPSIIAIRTRVEPPEAGKIEGRSAVEAGTRTTLVFLPNSGFRLTGWSIPGGEGNRFDVHSHTDVDIVAHAERRQPAFRFLPLLAAAAIFAGFVGAFVLTAKAQTKPKPTPTDTSTHSANGFLGPDPTFEPEPDDPPPSEGGRVQPGQGKEVKEVKEEKRVVRLCNESWLLPQQDCPTQPASLLIARIPKRTCELDHGKEKRRKVLICEASRAKAGPSCPSRLVKNLLPNEVPTYMCNLAHTAPPVEPTPPPRETTIQVNICDVSGLKAVANCPETVSRSFLASEAPERTCSVHDSVTVSVCLETGKRASSSCESTESRAFVRGREPNSCTKCTFLPWSVCKNTGLRPTAFCPVETREYRKGSEPTSRCQEHTGSEGARETVQVCSVSGLLPTAYCPETPAKRFAAGRVPTSRCRTHQPPY